MVSEIFLKQLNEILPALFIFIMILVLIRITYIICNKKKFILHKELLMLCFMIYILLLYYVVTFHDNNYGFNNLVPFREIFRYNINSALFFRNVIGNIILFIPFGIFTTYYVKNKRLFPTLLLSIIVSGLIEFAQNCIGRTTDIDDVILNIVGATFGYFLYKISWNISSKIPTFLKKQLFLDIFSLIIVLVIAYLIIKLDFRRLILWIT